MSGRRSPPAVACRALILLCAAAAAVAADGERIHWWNGQSRVDAVLALDELQVEARDAATLARERLAAVLPGLRASEVATAKSSSRARLRFAACADRAALDRQAAALAASAGVAGVRAVLHAAAGRDVEVGQLTMRLALRLRAGVDPAPLLARYRLRLVERVAYSPDTWIVESPSGPGAALDAANALYEREGALFAAPLIGYRHVLRLTPNDPLFPQQWHLANTGQVTGASPGSDINVAPAWDQALGAGVNIAIVDDGLQTDHPDLAPNARTDIDIDINNGDNDPSPAPTDPDDHGTFVAGLAGARGGNGLGVSGAAPMAGLVGVRLIASGFAETDQADAQAMNHQVTTANVADLVSINSNSWGPADDGASGPEYPDQPGPLMKAALANGTTNGRNGKGVVYVWAGGNGRGAQDNADYDGYANSRFVIAVGAIGPDGKQASYSESGANLLLVAPGGEFGGKGMVSTDRTGLAGFVAGDYSAASDGLVGTSFSAPLVSGVAALVLEAAPALTWRDVHCLLLRTATVNDPTDAGWITTGAPASAVGYPRRFNHRYGYGLVNAGAAVAAAQTWIPLPTPATATTAPLTVSETLSGGAAQIPDAPATSYARSLTLAAAADFSAERVELIVDITHPRRGDLHFQLVSPAGMVSDIPRRPNDLHADFSSWTFTSTAHWGEHPAGQWTLRVFDEAGGDVGTLNSWTLKVYGYVDAPPTVAALAAQVTNRDAALNVPVSVADSDTVVTSLHLTATSSDQSVVPDANLSFSAVSAGGANTLTVTPAAGRVGSALITVTVADATSTASTSFPLTVHQLPTVVAVSSPAADGAYGTGAVIPVTVTFAEPVTVSGGTPTLLLDASATPVAYSSGSGTSTLTFAYTVADGDRSPHLDCASAAALSAGGATIQDDIGNPAALALPAPGASGSLGASKALVVGGGIPVVTGLGSTAADGVYGVGATLPISVTFSAAVMVTGTPQLALATGTVPAQAAYVSGSGTATLVFGYTVAAGQSSSDLDAASTQALTLQGGSVSASADGRVAVLALPVPGQPGSLAASKNLVIDTTPHGSGKRRCGHGIFSLILLLALGAARLRALAPRHRRGVSTRD